MISIGCLKKMNLHSTILLWNRALLAALSMLLATSKCMMKLVLFGQKHLEDFSTMSWTDLPIKYTIKLTGTNPQVIEVSGVLDLDHSISNIFQGQQHGFLSISVHITTSWNATPASSWDNIQEQHRQIKSLQKLQERSVSIAIPQEREKYAIHWLGHNPENSSCWRRIK